MAEEVRGVARSQALFAIGLLATVVLFFSAISTASALPEKFHGMTAHGSMFDSEADWEALQKAGVQRFHMQIKWQTINEAGGGGSSGWRNEWAWQNTYDQYFEKAAKHGIEILPYLYTRKSGSLQYYWPQEEAFQEWKEFVWTVVQRYGQAGSFWVKHPSLPQYPVKFWEVWNEPNLAVNSLGGVVPNGQAYGEFLVATSKTIHEAQKAIYADTAKVLFGGLYQERWNSNIANYINQAAKAPGIASAYDGLSIHPYSFGLAGEPIKRTYPEKMAGVPSNVDAAYNAQKAAIGAKPLWITEIGWPITGNNAQTVSLAEQGDLLTGTFNWLKQNQAYYDIQYVSWYLYRDISDDPNTPWDLHAGLRATNGLVRPAWYAYQAQTGVPKWPADVPSVWPSDNLSGVITGDPDVDSWASGGLDVFVRGTDSNLHQKYYQPGVGWSGWNAVPTPGDKLGGGPSAESWENGRHDIVARGTKGQVLHWSWDAKSPGWYFDEALGSPPGGVTGDPDLTSWGPKRLDLFARGSNGYLWHRWYNGVEWGNWAQLPGAPLGGGPSAVSWGDGRIDVVARGTSGQVLHWSWDKVNSIWYFDESLGGQITSDPAISSWGSGRLDVFARGTDFRLVHRYYNNGSGWGPWESMGGSLLNGGPGAVSWGPGRIDVVARAYDDSVYHTAYEK